MPNSNSIKICSIACMARNYVIGKNNALIWHLPEDLKHFKRTTLGKPIIMGRKSYESLGKPLPGRTNIVISRQAHVMEESPPTELFKEMESVDIPEHVTAGANNLHFVKTIEESLVMGKKIAVHDGVDEIFITGGGEIYRQTMSIIDRLYLTVIDRDYEGDTFFPQFNWGDWTISHKTLHEETPALPSFTIYVLDRP